MWPSFDQSEQGLKGQRGSSMNLGISDATEIYYIQSLLTDNLASEVEQDMITMNLPVVN